MAIATLVVGAVIFFIGIGGQIVVGRRFAQTRPSEDRRIARIILTLAAIIIGAWLVIASLVSILHAHAHIH